MNKQSERTLVTYDLKIPSSTLLVMWMSLGWAAVAFGIIMTIMAFAQDNAANNVGTWLDVPVTGGLVLLALGVLPASIATKMYSDHYLEVAQGIIVGRGGTPILDDTYGTAKTYKILVEGNTHANQLRRQWHRTTRGELVNHEIGEIFDSRRS